MADELFGRLIPAGFDAHFVTCTFGIPVSWSYRVREAIYDKLDRELTLKSRITEARTVYLLVEIRKLMELRNVFDTYPMLRFCCDWALHTTLDRASAQKILQVFDAAQPYLCRGEPVPQDVDDRIRDMIRLDDFRTQLHRFLMDNGLPTHITGRRWRGFIQSYAGVIEDCPLTVRSSTLRNISSVTLQKLETSHRLRKRFPPYLLRWICRNRDEDTGSFELQNTID